MKKKMTISSEKFDKIERIAGIYYYGKFIVIASMVLRWSGEINKTEFLIGLAIGIISIIVYLILKNKKFIIRS